MSEAKSFEVCEYTEESFKELLISKSDSSSAIIESKQHYEYLNRYLKSSSVQGKTIVAELRYVDHDFLEDYSYYYVKCFRDLERKCCRLHFFQTSFVEEDLVDFLSGKPSQITKESLNDSYIGFIVIKPLPKTVFGRTCLMHYGEKASEYTRHFPITRKYPVNLFGIELSVQTLAFQEQDRVAAACATSALWSVFQGTGKLFQHAIPSPIEITKSATKHVPIESRVIPSVGLNAHQMAQAIREIGLEPLTVNAITEDLFKAHVYGYMKGKIPLLMGFSLYGDSKEGSEPRGKHAVAIGGYSLTEKNVPSYNGTGFLLKACRVDRIFVHDDQIGPFAKMKIDGKPVATIKNGKNSNKYSLSTSWKWADNVTGELVEGRAVDPLLLAPLYNKIRVPYITIHTRVFHFNEFLSGMNLGQGDTSSTSEIEWDIYLSSVNDFKKAFLEKSGAIDSNLMLHVLTKRMPKYVWVCNATINCGEPYLDLLFDTTGIEQGNLLLRVVEYDDEFSESIRNLLGYKDIAEIQSHLNNCDILKWLNTHNRLGVRIKEGKTTEM